jgi:hypothetical protein
MQPVALYPLVAELAEMMAPLAREKAHFCLPLLATYRSLINQITDSINTV